MARPTLLAAHHGLLVEVDGRGPHAEQFERDHRRQTNYDLLGFRWTSFTPAQIERDPLRVVQAIRALLVRV
jgi:very-short-patch-repair endonuclease